MQQHCNVAVSKPASFLQTALSRSERKGVPFYSPYLLATVSPLRPHRDVSASWRPRSNPL